MSGTQSVQIRHTTNPLATVPATQFAGSLLGMIAPAATKLWIADGTAARLLLSSVATDNPLGTANYLPLAGGTVTGVVNGPTPAPGTNTTQFATCAFVRAEISALQLYLGAYDAQANSPNITGAAGGGASNGDYYMVNNAAAAGTTPNAGIVWKGTAPTLLHNGDIIAWNATPTAGYEYFEGSSLTLAMGDARYLQLSGASPMTGPLNMGGARITNVATPTTGTDAANQTYVTGQLSSYLPLTGGILTGSLTMQSDFITLHANPTALMHAATKQYVDNNAGLGSVTVHTDGSLTGDGTATTPLQVAAINCGTF